MRKSIYTYAMILAMPVVALMTSCEPRALTPDDVFITEADVAELTADGKIYGLNEFLDTFMTEEGTYHNDTTPYRDRSYDPVHGLYMYSVDTLPAGGPGIYIRGRITTDDYAGNFYKAMVIQQTTDWATGATIDQQNLRISVDLGSSHGMYQMGQEILIRCNGLAVGRYANQPQLCIPSYNNNIYAMKASEKVGWCPGRIESSVFRRNTYMIGTPNIDEIKYDELTLADLYAQIPLKPTADAAGMDLVRKMDGRMIRLKDVHFTGKYQDGSNIVDCVVGNPDTVVGANVFAPSTQNIGYPQSRLLGDQGSNTLMCSNSEYAKFAYYYLPGADKTGVTNCKNFEGTVTGILGWYLDKASDLANGKLDGYEWSVTPRGIPGIGVEDIKMYYQGEESDPWIPKEFDPNDL